MQFVYFLIAAFNLIAIFCGLYLSHLVIGVYQASVNESAFFDRQLASSWIIADSAADAQSEYVKVLSTKAAYFLAEFVGLGFEHGLRLRRRLRTEHFDVFRLRVG